MKNGEGGLKPEKRGRPEWARKRDEQWKRIQEENGPARDPSPKGTSVRPGDFERKRALELLDAEEQKIPKRIGAAHSERRQRMRSPVERRKEKRADDASERIQRINVLLRAGVYDANHLKRLHEEAITVPLKLARTLDTADPISSHVQNVSIPKTEIEGWLNALTALERQRLYVIGRKKIEFPFDPKNYPGYSPEELAQEEEFQKEQKRLADALEEAAVPMLSGVADLLGGNADVYLSSPPDDLAGGIDLVFDFKDRKGNQRRFPDGSPMRLVIDVTYARMWNKLEKELERGRVSDAALKVLEGESRSVPSSLSNARAMKLFRSVVETLGSTMSTITFDKNGPLEKPQEHVPRLIIGLDWENAFSTISNWIEKGDGFEAWFRNTSLARRIAESIKNQLVGLLAIASEDRDNPNIPYLTALAAEVGAGRITGDRSLANLDRLLTIEADPQMSSDKQRLIRAARAQVLYDKKSGKRRVRGDMPVPQAKPAETSPAATEEKSEESGEMPDWKQQLAVAVGEAPEHVTSSTPEMKKIPEYKGGISLPKYDSSYAIERSPGDDTDKALQTIWKAWRRSYRATEGEHTGYRVIKEGGKELFWGDFVHNKMQNLNGQEQAYVRKNLPTVSQEPPVPQAEVVQVDTVPNFEVATRPSFAPKEPQQSEAERLRQRLMILDVLELRRRLAEAQRRQ